MKRIRTTHKEEKGTYFCTMGMLNCYLFIIYDNLLLSRGIFLSFICYGFFVILCYWACFSKTYLIHMIYIASYVLL